MTQLEQTVPIIDAASCMDMEQRKHPRHFSIDGGVIRLSVRPEFRGRRALLVDVSTGGIGFLLADALEEGTVLVFELKSPAGTEALSRIARVRHNRPHPTPADAPWLPATPMFSNVFRRLFGMTPPPPPKDAWLVGCEFDRPLDERDMKQVMQILTGGCGTLAASEPEA